MNLTTPIALILGPMLATAAALPLSNSSPQPQEPSSERLVDLLQSLGYAADTEEVLESSFEGQEAAEDPQEEEVTEKMNWTLGADEDPGGLVVDFEVLSQRRLLIGIYTQEPTELLAYHLGIPQESAVVVTGTVDGYPAARAGLQEHDVIIGVDGNSVATLDLLREALDKKKPGESLKLNVVQRGKRKELNIPLFLPEVTGKSPEAVNFFAGVEGEEVIEEEYENFEEEYELETAQLRMLDSQLRSQAMRAEMRAKRSALKAQVRALDAERASLEAERGTVKAQRSAEKSTIDTLHTRELSLRTELADLQASLANMDSRLNEIGSEKPPERSGRNLPERLGRYSNFPEGRRGAWIAGLNESEGGGAVIFFDDDGDHVWYGQDEEEEDEFDDEIFDRMDGFEDRLERIEDLLRRLVERNR